MENTTWSLKFREDSFWPTNTPFVILSENATRLYSLKNNFMYQFYFTENGLKMILNENEEYSSNRLHHVFSIADNKDLLIATLEHGLRMYIWDDQVVTKILDIKTQINWNWGETDIDIGRFFDNWCRMGAVVTLPRKKVKIFELSISNELKRNYHWEFVQNFPNISTEICQNWSDMMLGNLKKIPKQMLITKGDNGLCVFEVNKNDEIEIFIEIPYPGKEKITYKDRIFFANLSGHDHWMDMIVFNAAGLFLFEYHRESTELYKLFHYNPMFSTQKGWKEKYTNTVRFIDLNNDGFDEMIFTGPAGIEILSFDILNEKWISLLSRKMLTPTENHSIILHALPQVKGNVSNIALVTYRSGVIKRADITEIPTKIISNVPVNSKFPLLLKKNALVPNSYLKQDGPRSTIYLRDQNILLLTSESINPQTGKPHFVLPLVRSADSLIKFNLLYNADNSGNEPLGMGWSTQQSFIIANYNDGNFEEDEYNVLVVENIPHQLKLLSATPDASIYEIENTEHKTKRGIIQVTYFPSMSVWEVHFESGRKQYYGRYNEEQFGATVSDKAWSNWRGLGRDKIELIERDNIWYLATSEHKNETTYYEYEVIKGPKNSSQDSYISGVFVKKIHNALSELTFFYSKNDENKNLPFHLTGYNYKTKSKEQTIYFQYRMIEKFFSLVAIEQASDYIAKPVVQFQYCEPLKGNYALQEILLSTGVEIVYNYKRLEKKVWVNGDKVREVPVSDDYNVNYGPGFVVVSYIDKIKKQVILRMFSNTLSEEIFPPSSNSWPSLGNAIEAYEILVGDDFLAVVVYSAKSKTVYLFGRKSDGSWNAPKSFDYSEEATILRGNNFIVVSDPKLTDVIILEWKQEGMIWQKFTKITANHIHRSIAVHEKKFVIYDDQHLILMYRKPSKYSQWTFTYLKAVPGYLNGTSKILEKFDLEKDFGKSIYGFFRQNSIQFRNNLVVLSSLDFKYGDQLYTKLNIYSIGRNLSVVSEKYEIVNQDSFYNLESNGESHWGCFFTLKYGYEEDKFKIILGTYMNEISSFLSDFIKNEIRKMNSPAKHFLLDLKDYYISLSDQTLKCRNDIFSFGGKNWHKIQNNQTSINSNSSYQAIKLGDRFIVSKTDFESNLKLYDATNNEEIFDFGVTNLNKLRINYPIYIASQGGDKSVTLLEFQDVKEAKFTNRTLRHNSQLSPFGNAHLLVTHQTGPEFREKTVFLWNMYGLNRMLPSFTLNSVKTIFQERGESRERVTGYEYLQTDAQWTPNGIQYSRVSVLPGNNYTLYGFFAITQSNLQYFNGKGKLVKTVQKQNENSFRESGPKKELEKDKILYSRDGLLEIARFAPFSISSEMCSFVGFEEYEEIFSNWDFKREDIVSEGFSLTGKNFLHLNNSAIKRIFYPQFPDRPFVVTSWIRTTIEKISTPGDIVPYLTGAVLTIDGDVILTFLADVKYQIGDWLYVEVVIDLTFMRLVLEKANKFQTDNLQIEIQISSVNDSPIDVDHVRFGPLSNIFDVNVYDSELYIQIAIIKSNGAILRWIYDKYEVQIAEINESNQIAEFTTYTKQSSNSERLKNPMCVVKLIPEMGFYETFSPISFHSRWTLTHVSGWDISPGTLRHHTSTESTLLLTSGDIDTISYGIRFSYQLTNESLIVISNIVKMCSDRGGATISISKDESSKQRIKTEGEILLIQEGRRVIVWIDGGLYIDLSLDFCGSLSIAAEGEITFHDLMVFGRPKVQVTYKNALNEEVQQISVISDSIAIVKEILYDELGRPRITTQPTEVSRNKGQSLVAYIPEFVTNDDPSAPDSVWKSGKMFGDITFFHGHDYAFDEIVYEDNPLNIKALIALPGEEFSRNGTFVRRFNSTTSNVLVQRLYPLSQNYTYQVQYEMWGDEKISVFDMKNNEVATYIHKERGRDTLATFRYNERGLLVRSRPPMLNFQFGIFDKTSSNLIDIMIKDEDKYALETCIEYDPQDNPKRKTSPDMGSLENIYDEGGRLRFSIQFIRNKPAEIKSVTYYKYDDYGRLNSTGALKEPLPEQNQLLALTISDENSDQFQLFHHSDSGSDPALRRRILRSITKYHDKFLHEESILDVNNKLISKRNVYPNGSDQPGILAINKEYQGDLLKRLIYPTYVLGDLFQVVYEYDKLGRMTAVGMPGQRDFFMTIKYNANDEIREEVFLPADQNEFTRKYKYSKPGFLIEIDDKFLSQEISYTEKGYGNQAYGDGRVSRIKFSAKWHRFAKSDELGLREDSFIDELHSLEESKKCFQKLKNENYLGQNNQQMQIFYQNLDPKICFVCSGNDTFSGTLNQILGKHGFPKEYGYRFDYGFGMELEKAKYFVGSEKQEPEAFQPNTFAKNILGINYDQSRNIWLKLKSKGYISENSKGYGTLNIQSIMRESLNNDLTSLNGSFSSYTQVISKLLIKQFAERQPNNPNSKTEKIFVQELSHLIPEANKIKKILKKKNYFQDPLKSDFKDILEDFKNCIPEIVGVLFRAFGMDRAEFDMEFEEIDSNGNHIKFVSNFHKYTLSYEPNSNRISQISFRKNGFNQQLKVFTVKHDDRGNVIQAEHKGIKSLQYHVVSNRLEKAELENGNTIKLSYDSKGERALKQVINREGETISENYYLRDDNGRTLVERLYTFIMRDQPPDVLVTTYIYGPKSLIGFMRRNQFYSVITDHQNSIRLIVRDGEVVAAYDYMPYGSFMRVFESDPNAIIPYRYTGQEWDSELDLYNYHARLYDPLIGRFYQIDPLTQYFNPYEYAGNSPVSMVDPSGLVAFLLPVAIIGFGLLGAYLGGAASNKDYNILNWDWSSRDTQMAIFMGGVTGALIPVGFSGSLSALAMLSTFKAATVITSVGITTAYLGVAANQEKWNPGNWDYSPEMWNAAFEGFSMGVGILSSFHGAYTKFITLSRRSKYIFGTAVAFFGTQSTVMSDTKLSDIDNPKFWYSTIESAHFASDIPQIMSRGLRFTQKHHKILYQSLQNAAKSVFRTVLGYRRNKFPQYFIRELSLRFRQMSKDGKKFVFYMNTFAVSSDFMLGYIALSNLTELSTYHQIISAASLSTDAVDTAKIVVSVKKSKRAFTLAHNVLRILAEPLKVLRIRKFRRAIESDFQLLINDTLLSVEGSKITLIYAKNHIIYPFFFNRNPIEKISSIENELDEDIKIARKLIGLAPEVEKSLRRQYKDDLLRVNVSDWKIGDRTLNDVFDENITKLVEKIVYEILERDEYVNWEMVHSCLDKSIFESQKILNFDYKCDKKRDKLLALNNTLNENLDFMKRKSVLSKSKYLKNAMKNLKSRQLYEINHQKFTLSKIVWKHINEFQNSWLSWQVSNLCEPPLMMLSSIKEGFPFKHLPIPNAYQSTDDVRFLSSYKPEDIPELTVFQKCYNCLSATMRTGMLVRDISWSMLLNPNETSDISEEGTGIRKRRSVDNRSRNDDQFPNLLRRAIQKCQRIWKTLITENDERPLNAILQVSSLTIGENGRNHQNSFSNFTDLGDELFSEMATNDTLLLSGMFLAKYLKRKLNLSSKRLPISNFTQKLELACEVMEIYEESMKLSANASGIKFSRLRINNIPELYEQIISTYATANQLDKISSFLIESALEALSRSKVEKSGHLSARKRKLFEKKFIRTLNGKINELFVKMNGLTGRN